MKVVVLTVTVALVYSWSCTRSEFEELRFQDIPEEYFKHIILDAETGINGTDCIMSYKVEFKPGKTPLYLFNIERKSAIRRIYGAINGKSGRKPNWHDSNNREFMFFLRKCNGTDIPVQVFEQLRGFLSCNNTYQRNRPLRYYPWSLQGLLEKRKDDEKYRNRKPSRGKGSKGNHTRSSTAE